MKKLIFTLLIFIISVSTVNAQKGINFNRKIQAGGKLLMSVDSTARNVFYAVMFLNQPNTSFSYLPEITNLSIQIYFRKTDNIKDYRYTILVDDNPILVNKSINEALLTDSHAGGDEEVFRGTTLGIFSIKGKTITTLVYSIEKPQDIDKSIFLGKTIPKAKIKWLAKRYTIDGGVDYTNIPNPTRKTNIIFTEKDDELTIVKDRSDFDYLYYTSIKDKQTNKIIFESKTWQYNGYVEDHKFLPYIKLDKSIFKKSGDYEIIIQPLIDWKNCFDCNMPQKEIEKSTARYTLSITLDEENYTKKELIIYSLIAAISIGLGFLVILYFIKRKNNKKLAEQEQQKGIAKLHLNSIRSQLNPHFLFNALAGIQNLMNKDQIDNANRYLTKFARLTRNVLDSKELISLNEEKALLDDYLQMEQLRFGFQYQITVTTDLDIQNIEIPAMLLQPFVENAVKHGIAEKGNNGHIEINFKKQFSDLILEINDNGSGFDTKNEYAGLGLNLSKNRISLLNTIYKETPFVLNIQSNINGTMVTITLKQWL